MTHSSCLVNQNLQFICNFTAGVHRQPAIDQVADWLDFLQEQAGPAMRQLLTKVELDIDVTEDVPQFKRLRFGTASNIHTGVDPSVDVSDWYYTGQLYCPLLFLLLSIEQRLARLKIKVDNQWCIEGRPSDGTNSFARICRAKEQMMFFDDVPRITTDDQLMTQIRQFNKQYQEFYMNWLPPLTPFSSSQWIDINKTGPREILTTYFEHWQVFRKDQFQYVNITEDSAYWGKLYIGGYLVKLLLSAGSNPFAVTQLDGNLDNWQYKTDVLGWQYKTDVLGWVENEAGGIRRYRLVTTNVPTPLSLHYEARSALTDQELKIILATIRRIFYDGPAVKAPLPEAPKEVPEAVSSETTETTEDTTKVVLPALPEEVELFTVSTDPKFADWVLRRKRGDSRTIFMQYLVDHFFNTNVTQFDNGQIVYQKQVYQLDGPTARTPRQDIIDFIAQLYWQETIKPTLSESIFAQQPAVEKIMTQFPLPGLSSIMISAFMTAIPAKYDELHKK